MESTIWINIANSSKIFLLKKREELRGGRKGRRGRIEKRYCSEGKHRGGSERLRSEE